MMLFEETSKYMGFELDHEFLNAYTEAWNQQQGPAFFMRDAHRLLMRYDM